MSKQTNNTILLIFIVVICDTKIEENLFNSITQVVKYVLNHITYTFDL